MRRIARLVAASALTVGLVACAAKVERYPTSADYPAGTMERVAVQAGGHPWRLSALETPRTAPWKVVVVTGTPSWSEFWAPVLATLPERFTMIVEAFDPGRTDDGGRRDQREYARRIVERLADIEERYFAARG